MKTFAPHQKDAYKISHKQLYAPGTTKIYSNFTPRSGKHSNLHGSIGIWFIGTQYFIRSYLIDEWNESFFNKPKQEVIQKYKRRVSNILQMNVDVSHIEELYDIGYLPLKIKALPEGSFVPYGIPVITITETNPKFFWLVNMIESVLSSELWHPITAATTYMGYRSIAIKWAKLTGCYIEDITDNTWLDYQIWDFSYRGIPGRQAAAISGFSVLATGAIGSDCVPAVDIAEDYYYANSDTETIMHSVCADEHSCVTQSIMAIISSDNFESIRNEFYTRIGSYDVIYDDKLIGEYWYIKNIITNVVPSGIFSHVSDSFDLFSVVNIVLPLLKHEITSRNGTLVIRPDSSKLEGPEGIICGDPTALYGSHEYKGVVECLWDIFSGNINDAGFKELDSHISTIYGDSITTEREEEIFLRLHRKKFASKNVVLGMGSYSILGQVSRDTHGFAMKATYSIVNNKQISIYKDPKTDDGTKRSAKGLLMVTKVGNEYRLVDNVSVDQERHGCLETIFENGKLVKRTTLSEIRKTVDTFL